MYLKSLHKTITVFFHIYSSMWLWTQRVNLLKFCNIPNQFCLGPLFSLYSGGFFVDYLCFQLCASVPDLLEKKRKFQNLKLYLQKYHLSSTKLTPHIA